MAKQKFAKYHSCGNSCVIFSRENHHRDQFDTVLVRTLLDQRFGVGADNLLVVSPTKSGVFQVSGFNSDATPVGMCANGARCVAQYLRDEQLISNESSRVEFNLDGEMVIASFSHEDKNVVGVSLRAPSFRFEDVPCTLEPSETPKCARLNVAGAVYDVVVLNIGNPHCVVQVPDLSLVELQKLGPLIEHHPHFPEKTNVEFVERVEEGQLRVLFWERAVGVTAASGSGSAAVFSAMSLLGVVQGRAELELPGGTFHVEETSSGGVRVEGPVKRVCSGLYYLEEDKP